MNEDKRGELRNCFSQNQEVSGLAHYVNNAIDSMRVQKCGWICDGMVDLGIKQVCDDEYNYRILSERGLSVAHHKVGSH